MKKLFSVLAIAALVSCNSGSDKKTEEVKPADSTAVAPAPAPAADTTAKAAPATDTTAKAK